LNRSTSEASPQGRARSRLSLPDRYADTVSPDQVHPGIAPVRLQALANAALEADPLRFGRAAERVLAQCRDAEEFLEQAVSGTAMALGAWCSDRRIEVPAVQTAAQRLEELVFEVADEHLAKTTAAPAPWTILLARAPGSSHTLGSFIAAELFNWHGWSVISGPAIEAERVARTLALERVDVLGVTVSEERELLPVHRLISHCRSVSRNSALIVVVGGTQAFLRKELAKEVNADLVATQVSTARLQLLTMLEERRADSPPG